VDTTEQPDTEHLAAPAKPRLDLSAGSVSKFQLWLMAAAAFLVCLYFIAVWFGGEASDRMLDKIKDDITTVLILAGLVSAAIATYVVPRLSKLGENISGSGGAAGALLEDLRQERESIRQRAQGSAAVGKDFDVTTTIELNLNKLNEYYTLNLSQAARSFGMSITLIMAGFGLLCFGIWKVMQAGEGTTTVAVLSSISGILLQFIGGTAFWLYGKSLNQLNLFFAQLVRMQDTMLGIKLVDKITGDDNRSRVTESIILKLLDAKVVPADYYVDQSYSIPANSDGQEPAATSQSSSSEPAAQSSASQPVSTAPAESSSASLAAATSAAQSATPAAQSLDSASPTAKA
jgi:hypothetical protein